MLICVTGATGFVGNHLCFQLLKLNYKIVAPVRKIREDKIILNKNIKYIQIECFENYSKWQTILKNIDCVIHCAAKNNSTIKKKDDFSSYSKINTQFTIDLAKHAANVGVKKFIFLSSIKVNGENNLKESSFKYFDSPNPQDYYSISKWKAEIELRKLSSIVDLKLVIIRPPLVYGPKVEGNFLKLLNIIFYFPIIPNVRKNFLRSYVSIDNLISFIIHSIKHPKSANKTFLISDGQDISFQSLIKILSKKMNKKVFFFTIPNFFIDFFCKFKNLKKLISKLFCSMRIDIFYNYDLLGWKPVYNLDEELTKMVKWYLAERNHDKKN